MTLVYITKEAYLPGGWLALTCNFNLDLALPNSQPPGKYFWVLRRADVRCFSRRPTGRSVNTVTRKVVVNTLDMVVFSYHPIISIISIHIYHYPLSQTCFASHTSPDAKSLLQDALDHPILGDRWQREGLAPGGPRSLNREPLFEAQGAFYRCFRSNMRSEEVC